MQSSIPSPHPTNAPRQLQPKTTFCLCRRAKAPAEGQRLLQEGKGSSLLFPLPFLWPFSISLLSWRCALGKDCRALTAAPRQRHGDVQIPRLLFLPISKSHLFCCVYTQKTRGCPLFSSSHDTSNYPASKYPIWLLVFSFFLSSF